MEYRVDRLYNRRISTCKRQDIDCKFPAGDISKLMMVVMMMMHGKPVSKMGEILFFWKLCMNLTSRERDRTNALRKFRHLSLFSSGTALYQIRACPPFKSICLEFETARSLRITENLADQYPSENEPLGIVLHLHN